MHVFEQFQRSDLDGFSFKGTVELKVKVLKGRGEDIELER